jgi:hypothetical protein
VARSAGVHAGARVPGDEELLAERVAGERGSLAAGRALPGPAGEVTVVVEFPPPLFTRAIVDITKAAMMPRPPSVRTPFPVPRAICSSKIC